MKKLYRKGAVHPSPTPPSPLVSDHHLAFLPAAILALTAALSPQDREVLVYLLSDAATPSSAGNRNNKTATHHHKPPGGGAHVPAFGCSCFGCYTSYWARWDSSPNRQLIDEIIDSFEDWLAKSSSSSGVKGPKSRKERRRRGFAGSDSEATSRASVPKSGRVEPGTSPEESAGAGEGDFDGEEGGEKGSVRKFVSLIGERIWNVWGQ